MSIQRELDLVHSNHLLQLEMEVRKELEIVLHFGNGKLGMTSCIWKIITPGFYIGALYKGGNLIGSML